MRYVRSLFTGLVALVLVLPASSAKPRVLFRTANYHWMRAPAYVNGRGPFEFLVDTGTSTTLIDAPFTRIMKMSASSHRPAIAPKYSLDKVSDAAGSGAPHLA